MTAALRLARLVLSGHPDAHGLAARMVSEATAKARRVRAKRAPRLKAERASKEARRDRSAEIRAAVFARAGGVCEMCCRALPTEWHHLASGASRGVYEAPTTTVAICLPCHREWHQSDPAALCRSLEAATRIGAPSWLLASLRRRIDKASH